MRNRRKYLQVVIFAVINAIAFPFIDNYPPKAFPGIETQINSLIIIAGNIKDSFPCIYNLIKEVTTFNNRNPQTVLNNFWVSDKIEIVFVDEELAENVEAITDSADLIPADGRFRARIRLNRKYLPNASRDHLAAVVMHEGLHAYFKWCILSYTMKKNGVTKQYLRKHFPVNWRWLTKPHPYISEYEHHILMSENYIEEMVSNIYPFTNPESGIVLRNTVALCFAWGGLHDTPAWKKSTFDTCFVHSVNAWGRTMNAPDTAVYGYGKCVSGPKSLFDTLQLRFPCH